MAMASPQTEAYLRALESGRADGWPAAQAEARGMGRELIEWARLRSGHGEFGEYRAFLAKHPDWPGLEYLHQRGEGAIPEGADPAQVIAYFADQTPETGDGVWRLIEAYLAKGESGDAEALAVLAWRSLSLNAEVETHLFTRFAKLLKPHHEARADMLMWDREFRAANRMAPRLGKDWQALLTAREALAKDRPGVDAFIEAVPAKLQDHPGLAYERFAWRARKDRDDGAIEIMLAQSKSADALGQPERWADRRSRLARILMRNGKGEAAYTLASNHHLSEGSDYADLEWLSGYIALRLLQDPVLALDHFNRFRLAVATPISLGRAGYWEGRALELMGAAVDAQAAYAFGAKHQTSFYGLLSAEKAGIAMDADLASGGKQPDFASAPYRKSSVYEAALFLVEAGDLPLAGRFFRHLGESLSEAELLQLSAEIVAMKEPYLAVRIGKFAADRGIVVPSAYYPMHPLAQSDLPVPAELALSIARRESEFYVAARSGVGARGLMQVMPGTAKEMAEALELDYVLDDLTTDGTYNAKLGSAYLAQLIEEFGPAPALVAAGYNAGPSRPRAWIKERGDPREAGVDPIDWIESIPYEETRNYVMRVMESLPVYRARLTGKAVPIRISEELRGR
ncbi:MAG: soluble lytic murein transglycosylase [Halocynthiibacter sp.]|jgi:soluble lytic murein transglycosylase